ncbi:MAG: nitroreductase [Oscillospiraceae bacterium]|nr:nitroreductase [Oscillospiraceae bacterium]
MNMLEAIDQRCSRRAYLDKLIGNKEKKLLDEKIAELNAESGLSIALVENCAEAFAGFRKSYGLLKGVNNCFALKGDKNIPKFKEKLGFYGEMLVLYAETLGLSTCWVGGSYDKSCLLCELQPDEELNLVIVVGYAAERKSARENAIYKITHRKSKTAEEMCEYERGRGADNPPDWFFKGMCAVAKAPSANNKQPVKIYCKNGEITALDGNSDNSVDLGIAKAHFYLATGISI